MKHTECKDCKLGEGDCGYHFKMDGITDYDIPRQSSCDQYDNCMFFQQKPKVKRSLQNKWIPVSERLPDECGYYLVTTDGSHNAVIDIAKYDKFFRIPGNKYVLEWNKASRVIAWQQLPEPYNEGGEENANI